MMMIPLGTQLNVCSRHGPTIPVERNVPNSHTPTPQVVQWLAASQGIVLHW